MTLDEARAVLEQTLTVSGTWPCLVKRNTIGEYTYPMTFRSWLAIELILEARKYSEKKRD